jgi:DNA-binding response OmpR family regulator
MLEGLIERGVTDAVKNGEPEQQNFWLQLQSFYDQLKQQGFQDLSEEQINEFVAAPAEVKISLIPNCSWDPSTRILSYNDKHGILGEKEGAMFTLLLEHVGEVVSYGRLQEVAYKEGEKRFHPSAITGNILDKIRRVGLRGTITIETVRGKGYVLDIKI